MAQWIAEFDPEIVGLSDVADDELRRRATLRLLGRFRVHELTDAQVVWEKLSTSGLKYPGIENDLRPVLKERADLCEDVLRFTIDVIDKCEITSLHDDLADLALDPSAPLDAREAAGYVLQRNGARTVRARLKALVAGSQEDEQMELKGIALQCCWPEALSSEELISVLIPRRDRSFHGAYVQFLLRLGNEGFDASDCRAEGLEWAKGVLRPKTTTDLMDVIVKRIARGALTEIRDPRIGAALTELLLEANRIDSDSPLGPIQSYHQPEESEDPVPLASDPEVRRLLIQHLAAKAGEGDDIKMVAITTPGLRQPEDFSWLLENAVDETRGQAERESLAAMASIVPFQDNFESVETWLRLREHEPIRSTLNYHLSVELESDTANQLKSFHRTGRPQVDAEKHDGCQSPVDRVRQSLELAETKAPEYFFNLCKDLTLTVGATHYGFDRFLTRTPGWGTATPDVRAKVVEAARRILIAPTDEPERWRSAPLNSLPWGHMCAVWLLLEVDPEWLDRMSGEWWNRWSWYLLRGLQFTLSGEPREPKHVLFKRLHQRAGGSVRDAALMLSQAEGSDFRSFLMDLVELYRSVQDAELDKGLLNALQDGAIIEDRILEVAQFLLGRDRQSAVGCCTSILNRTTELAGDVAAYITSALLDDQSSAAWSVALSFLREHPELARATLGKYALRSRGVTYVGDSKPGGVKDSQIGEIIAILFEHYPPESPESDPAHDGFYFETEVDSAVFLRSHLIGILEARKTKSALDTLKVLETRFGEKYPWLRRPRSSVERAYRRSNWRPIPPTTVAQLLLSNDKHLICSEADAVEGIVAAIELFEHDLRHVSPPMLEDLWNTPTGCPPTPKTEERISDKLCGAAHRYFKNHAVTANREVQIRRRLVPSSCGGEPGARADIMVSVPAQGAETGDPIVVPIEVKRSDNREAKTTGLPEQLFGRYMSELGTEVGVFVVVWLTAPGLSSHSPVWSSIQEAREHLEDQIKAIRVSSDGVQIKAIVVDASLS